RAVLLYRESRGWDSRCHPCYAAKHMFNQKHYTSGINYYIAYFKRKLLE
ncbi:hypothetical protein LTSEUGA_5225, partial [Salmonella enterica subsp. enterica serovar Uganda str. R8-3404]